MFITVSSPYFWIRFYNDLFKGKPILKKKARDTFYNLKRRGLIVIERKNKNIYMYLTKKEKLKPENIKLMDYMLKSQKNGTESGES